MKRLRRATGDQAFAVFSSAQDHLLEVARAHVDRVVLEAFVDAFAIPQDWLDAAIVDEEADRQDATFAEDQRVQQQAGGWGAGGPGADETATNLEVAPAQ